jgi:hypothetical protein
MLLLLFIAVWKRQVRGMGSVRLLETTGNIMFVSRSLRSYDLSFLVLFLRQLRMHTVRISVDSTILWLFYVEGSDKQPHLKVVELDTPMLSIDFDEAHLLPRVYTPT